MGGAKATATRLQNEGYLNPFVALWYAFVGKTVVFYPRVHDSDADTTSTIETADVVGGIARVLDDLKADKDGIAKAMELARASLDEVKELTEYQDQKATRLLTILAFLSALAGVLFARLAEAVPPQLLLAPPAELAIGNIVLVWAAYVLFLAFAFCLISGALITFKATQSRFRFPKSLANTSNGKGPARPKSRTFFVGMLSVSPADWAASFLDRDNSSALEPALSLDYLKNYISESYLIAGKVADKLRFLMPAQWFQQMAIRILLVWVMIFVAAVVITPHSSPYLPGTPPIEISEAPPHDATTGVSTGETVPVTTTATTAPQTVSPPQSPEVTSEALPPAEEEVLLRGRTE